MQQQLQELILSFLACLVISFVPFSFSCLLPYWWHYQYQGALTSAWLSIAQHSHRCSALSALFSIAGIQLFWHCRNEKLAISKILILITSFCGDVLADPIRLIESCTFSFLGPILRSYSTFNRDIHKIYQPIRLIESILIIETQEYDVL